MAYSVVAVCVLILRYRPPDNQECLTESNEENIPINLNLNSQSRKQRFMAFAFGRSDEPFLQRLFRPASQKCNHSTSHIVNVFAFIAGNNLKYFF
jgi:hypothetical protein